MVFILYVHLYSNWRALFVKSGSKVHMYIIIVILQRYVSQQPILFVPVAVCLMSLYRQDVQKMQTNISSSIVVQEVHHDAAASCDEASA